MCGFVVLFFVFCVAQLVLFFLLPVALFLSQHTHTHTFSFFLCSNPLIVCLFSVAQTITHTLTLFLSCSLFRRRRSNPHVYPHPSCSIHRHCRCRCRCRCCHRRCVVASSCLDLLSALFDHSKLWFCILCVLF